MKPDPESTDGPGSGNDQGAAPAACPKCGKAFRSGELEGFCPACLMTDLLPKEQSIDPETPTVEELDAQIDDYEILDLIGAGGMGAVFRARQQSLNREVAIKVLTLEPESEMNFAERFRQEAHAMAALNHPNIVSVHDFGETGEGIFFLVMELIEGADLRQMLQTTQISPADALRWAQQIGDALHYAHGEGVVHRDIKPSNILVTAQGEVKIGDFGLAKLTSTTRSDVSAITTTSVAMGTADYAAPEQISLHSNEVDHRVDLFSLGVVLYEMLTGDMPRGHWKAPSAKSPQVSKTFDSIVARAMAEEPDDRYQDASEITGDLQRLDRSLTRQASNSGRRRLFKKVTAVCLLLGALAAAVYFSDQKWGRGRPATIVTLIPEIVVQHKHRIVNLGLLPESKTVIACGDDGTLFFPSKPDAPSLVIKGIRSTKLKMTVLTEKQLLIADSKKPPTIFDLDDGTFSGNFQGDDTYRHFAAPDGKAFLQVRPYQSNWWYFTTDKNEPAYSLSSKGKTKNQIHDAVFLPDGKHFITASGRGDRFKSSLEIGELTIFRVDSEKPVAIFGELECGYNHLLLSPDGTELFAAGTEGTLSKYSIQNLSAPRRIEHITAPAGSVQTVQTVHSLHYLTETKQPLVVTSIGTQIRFFSARTLREVMHLELATVNPRSLVVHHGQRMIYFCAVDEGSKVGAFNSPDKCRVYRVAIPDELY